MGLGTSNFTIPRAHALVVTDVDWSCFQAAAGTEIFFDLTSVIDLIILETQATRPTAMARAHATEVLTSGVVVTRQLLHAGAVSVQCGFWEVRLHGYLVPNI
jgi:hypothetical protein